jgi:hypothetical protein
MPGVRLLRIECETCARLVSSERRAASRNSELNDSVVRCAAALPLILDIARRALNNSLRGGWRALIGFKHGQPNIGMHPTGESGNVIRKVGGLYRFFPAGDAGRYIASSNRSAMS